jgi:putative SOS response-associated peptidase YedK
MCNLYKMRRTSAEITHAFRAKAPSGLNLAEEVYPGYPGLVIREEAGARQAVSMHWGFPLRLKSMKPTSKPKPVNNARDDKLMTPFWRKYFVEPQFRCLIPFTEFAEAEGPKGKMTRTWISTKDQELPAWAGLWRPSDEWGDVYTGVMVDATAELWHIHDRMPVILQPENHDKWLNASPEEAQHLLTKYPADQLAVERTDVPWIKRSQGPKLL